MCTDSHRLMVKQQYVEFTYVNYCLVFFKPVPCHKTQYEISLFLAKTIDSTLLSRTQKYTKNKTFTFSRIELCALTADIFEFYTQIVKSLSQKDISFSFKMSSIVLRPIFTYFHFNQH